MIQNPGIIFTVLFSIFTLFFTFKLIYKVVCFLKKTLFCTVQPDQQRPGRDCQHLITVKGGEPISWERSDGLYGELRHADYAAEMIVNITFSLSLVFIFIGCIYLAVANDNTLFLPCIPIFILLIISGGVRIVLWIMTEHIDGKIRQLTITNDTIIEKRKKSHSV